MTQGSACSELNAESDFEPLLYFLLFAGGQGEGWQSGGGRGKINGSRDGRAYLIHYMQCELLFLLFICLLFKNFKWWK